MASKLYLYLVLLILMLIINGIDARTRRKRRGVWPDILAPGANTFANLGYYGMQSYIAYPESGIAINPYWQNPYYASNQFNNYNPNVYNTLYPSTNNGQGAFYGGMNMNNFVPYTNQENYNQIYPNNLGMFNGPFRSAMLQRRTAAVNTNERVSSTT